MEYTVKSIDGGMILISVDDAKEELPYLEDEFRKCSTENCACQTDELKKLDFMNIINNNDRLDITLTPLPQETFDIEEIENFVVAVLSYVYLIDNEEKNLKSEI